MATRITKGGFQSIPDTNPLTANQDRRAEGLALKKQNCLMGRGTWDEATGTCTFPQKQEKTKVDRSRLNPNDTVITDRQGNERIQTPEDVKRAENEAAFRNTLGGGLSAAEGIAQQEENAKKLKTLEGLGLTPEEIALAQAQATEAPIDIGQAATAGISNIPSLIKGIGGGAAAGALSAAPIGAALTATGIGAPAGGVVIAGGAIIGGIASVWNSVLSNIKSQQAGEIGAAQDVLANAKTNMRTVARIAKTDPQLAADVYDQWLAETYKAERKLKLETSGNLNAFMDDGTEKLSDFELFLQPGGQAENYAFFIRQYASGALGDLSEEEVNAFLEGI